MRLGAVRDVVLALDGDDCSSMGMEALVALIEPHLRKMRARERIGGSSMPGRWVTSRKNVPCGGSSRRLHEQCDGVWKFQQ